MYSGGDDIQSRDLILDILFFYKLFTGAVQLLHPVAATQSSTFQDESYDGVSMILSLLDERCNSSDRVSSNEVH